MAANDQTPPTDLQPVPALYPSSPPPGLPETNLPPSKQGVSIVIPAYNESLGIVESLQELVDVLSSMPDEIPYEVILVDDGSTDDTSEKAAAFDGGPVRVITKKQNQGYGAAIKTGVHQAKYPWIAITDADGTYAPGHFPTLLKLRDNNHMVVGARTTKGAAVPLIRRPAKWVLRRLSSILIQQHIPDLNSGQRVILKSIFDRYERLLPDQFSLTTTITLVMFSSGYSVHYEPVEYRRRKGSSKIRPIHDVIAFLTLIVRTVVYFNPLRIFLPISLFFFLASVGVAVGSYFMGRLMDVATLLLFVTAVQVGALGILADVINRRGN